MTWPVLTWLVLTWFVLTWPFLTWPVLTWPVLTGPVLTLPVLTWPVETWPVLTWPVLTWPVLTWPVRTWPYLTWPVVTRHPTVTNLSWVRSASSEWSLTITKQTWFEHLGFRKIWGQKHLGQKKGAVEKYCDPNIFEGPKIVTKNIVVEFRQGSIGTIRSSLATSYDVWRRRVTLGEGSYCCSSCSCYRGKTKSTSTPTN